VTQTANPSPVAPPPAAPAAEATSGNAGPGADAQEQSYLIALGVLAGVAAIGGAATAIYIARGRKEAAKVVVVVPKALDGWSANAY
jgi:hypothetical protein